MPTTRWQLPECLDQRQSLDLATKSDLAVRAKADDVEDFLPDVDADRGQRLCGGVHGVLLRMLRGSLCRLSQRGKQPVHPISGLPSLSWARR
jgi:hypothetical protein